MKHHLDICVWLLRQGCSADILEGIQVQYCLSSSLHLPNIVCQLLVSYLQFVGLIVFAYFGSPFTWSIDYQIFILN